MGQTDEQTTGNDAADNNPTAPTTKSPDVGQTYDRSLVYADDDKLWREKFTGQQGRADELARELEKARKEHEGALEELNTQLGTQKSENEKLTGKLESAGEQLGKLQALEDRLPELEQQARQAAKYRAIMEYPELINRQMMDTIETENGEEHEIAVNPILDLVENANLEGDDLRTHLRRLNEIIKSSQPEPGETNTSVTENAIPSPGETVEESPEYWEQKADEARQQANANPSQRQKHIDEMLDATQKAREARAKLQS